MQNRNRILLRSLGVTLVVGLLLRLCSAYFVYGPQALDDYKHGVLPAYQWATGQLVALPGYRSFLLTWVLGWPIKILEQLSVHHAITQVRAIYVELALISLIAWAGVVTYAKTFRQRRFAIYLMILLAVYPLMPFVSTRAFGEAIALPLVLCGMTLSEAGRRRGSAGNKSFALGLFLLGLATFFRFQVGVLYVVYSAILVYRREWRLLGISALVGIGLLVLQGFIDLLSGRQIFETLKDYIKANEGGAAQYGVSPWYNTWTLVLGLTLFPLSLGFVRELKKVWQRHWRIILPLLVFVLIHSLMPHKEERFMYPIVGLVLLVLAEALAEARRRKFTRLVYIPVLSLVTVVGLLITCFNNTQVGEIGPAAEINRLFPRAVLIDKKSLLGQSRIKEYFVRPPSEVITTSEPLNKDMVDLALAQQTQWDAVGLLTSDLEVKNELDLIANTDTVTSRCGAVQAASSWTDAFIYRMNPKHNQRRRPTWFVICERRA